MLIVYKHTVQFTCMTLDYLRHWCIEHLFSIVFVSLQQEQLQILRPASPSHPRFRPAAGLGPTSAPSATRTPWTRSSTPVGTCACATPVASNSRRCPTPAAPSAGGRLKTLSRPIAARKGTGATGRPQQNPGLQKERFRFREHELWYSDLVFSYKYWWLVFSRDLFQS